MADTRADTPNEADKASPRELPPRLEWLDPKWWHALAIHLFWPGMLLGTLYVFVFFFVNSSPFANLIEAQLDASMMGTFRIGDVTVGAWLDKVEIRDIYLYEPNGDQVLSVARVDAKIPAWELLAMVTRDQLTLGQVDVRETDILLDFRGSGPFNLLRAVASVAPSDAKSDLSIAFESVNVLQSHILLRFDDFEVDFEDVDMRGFSMLVGPSLSMNTRPSVLGDYGVRAAKAEIRIDPTLIGFPLGQHNDLLEGLIGGAGGTAGRIAHAQRNTTRVMMAARARMIGDDAALAPPTIGPLVVPLRNIVAEDFWWRDATYGVTRLSSQISSGTIEIHQPWMNLAPTLGDIQESADRYGHIPSKAAPEDTIIYRAAANLHLPADDPLIRYFAGPIIDNDAPIDLTIDVSGDFRRAGGQVAVITQGLNVAGVEVGDLRLTGELDGQRFDLVDFNAELLDGVVSAYGHYMIIDGDFDLSVEIGEVDVDAGSERTRGINPAPLLGDAGQPFASTIAGALRLVRKGAALSVGFYEPLVVRLVDPYAVGRIQEVVLTQNTEPDDEPVPMLSWQYRVLRVLDGFEVRAGKDYVELEEGLVFRPDAMAADGFEGRARVGNIARYLEPLGISGISTKDLSLRAAAHGTPSAPNASARLTVRGLRYDELAVDNVTIDGDFAQASATSVPNIKARATVVGARYGELRVDRVKLAAGYNGDRIAIQELEAQTPYGDLQASGWVKPFTRNWGTLRDSIPMDISLVLHNVPLDKLPPLTDQHIAGSVDARARVRGTHTDPQVEGHVDVRDLRVMGERIATISSDLAYRRGAASVRDFTLFLATDQQPNAPHVHLAEASYDIANHSFSVIGELNAIDLQEIAHVREAAPITGVLSVQVDASGDVDAFTKGTVDHPLIAKGSLALQGAAFGERALGDLDLAFDTTDKGIAVAGRLFEHFEVEALASTGRPLAATGTVRFDSLDWLGAFPELAEAINGDRLVHLDPTAVAMRKVPLSQLRTTGSVQVGFHEDGGLQGQVNLDKLSVVVFNEPLANDGPLRLAYDHTTGSVSIDRVALQHEGKTLMLWGRAAVDGTLGLELNGEVSAGLARLAGASVTNATGSLALALTAAGTLIKDGKFDLHGLELGGFVAVREPIRLQIRGLGTDPVVIESGVIGVDDKELCGGQRCFQITQGRALRGQLLGGRFSIEGKVVRDAVLPVAAELTLTANNLSPRLGEGLTLTAEIPSLTLTVDDIADPDTYLLSGEVIVAEALFRQKYDLQGELLQQGVIRKVLKKGKVERYQQPIWRKIPLLAKLNLDLKVASASGVRVEIEGSGANAEVELAVDLRLEGTLKEPRPTGTVDFRDGKLVFRKNEFHLTSGQLAFGGDLDATIELSAEAEIDSMSNPLNAIGGGGTTRDRRVRTADLASGSQIYTVFLSIAGRLSAFEVLLDSQPRETPASIATLILTGRTLDGLSENQDESPALNVAIETLLAPMFEAQVDQVLDADEFQFMVLEGAAQFVYIQQVNRALRIAAGVNIRGGNENESALAAEYRVEDDFSIEAGAQNTIEEEGKAPVQRVRAGFRWRIPLD